MIMLADDAAWSVTTPSEAGFAEDLADRFEIARAAGVLPNLHGVVVARDGRICFERYLSGTDAARARPLGVIRFGPDTLHDLRSVTKSIVALLYGIALARTQVPPPTAPLLEQFPQYPDLARDPDRQRLTISHALTMTLGTEWDEITVPYSDPRNSEIAMDQAPDRIRFVLERTVVGPPGVRWNYSGGATALLGRLIAQETGKTLPDFARVALFEPLGIADMEWETGADGEAIAASGLRLRLRDLALVGAMALQGGRWKGSQVVPDAWVTEAFKPRIAMPDGRRFGYHWYLGAVPMNDGYGGTKWEETISAAGNGGQRLFLLPRLRLVVAVTAGNYDAADQWRPPMAVLRDILLPARTQKD